MKAPIPKRSRTKYTKLLAELKPRGHIYLASAKPDSIKAIASRLGKRLKRTYYTQYEQNGCSVWRET